MWKEAQGWERHSRAQRKALPQLRLCRKTALISQLMEEGGDSGQFASEKRKSLGEPLLGAFWVVMFGHQCVYLKASRRMEGEESVNNNNYHISATVHLTLRKWKHICIPSRFEGAPQLEVPLSAVQHTNFEASCRNFAPVYDVEYLTLLSYLSVPRFLHRSILTPFCRIALHLIASVYKTLRSQ